MDDCSFASADFFRRDDFDSRRDIFFDVARKIFPCHLADMFFLNLQLVECGDAAGRRKKFAGTKKSFAAPTNGIDERTQRADEKKSVGGRGVEKRFGEKLFGGRQTKILDSTRVKIFCHSPLINAALSIYFRRAEKSGIKIEHKIDLPKKISTDESDLAVLVSNLLENAIDASKKISEKKISLIMRNAGGQNVLEIENFFDRPIKIGENGLPYTTTIGHGLGMSSLELFAKKYDAFVDFSHEEKIVRLSLYWND